MGLLEPFITWPKNFVLGTVRGVSTGLSEGAPWGALLGGIGAAGWQWLAVASVMNPAAVTGIVGMGIAGAILGAGAGAAGGGALGLLFGGVHGVLNNGGDAHHVENQRFTTKTRNGDAAFRRQQERIEEREFYEDLEREEDFRELVEESRARREEFQR